MVTDTEFVDPVKRHHIKGMGDIPLVMFTMPKLYPLSQDNRRAVRQEIKNWTDISEEARQRSITMRSKYPGHSINKHKFINELLNQYTEKHPDSILTPLFEFLSNYDPDQYEFDIGQQQFKQTKDGKIVLLDPIVSKELMDLFINNAY